MERVREAVVAAIDERRLMVSQFYIESREHALRASEEKYRTTIDHAPDPMYEIEPYTWIVQGANAAAEAMYRIVKDHEDKPLVGRRLTELGPPEDIPHILSHVEKVVRDGSDQIRDWPEAGRYFDVNSALIPFGNERFIHMILHDVTQRREMLDELLQRRAAGRGRHLRRRRGARGQQPARLDLLAGAVAAAGRDRRRAAHHAAHDPFADHAHLGHAQGPGRLRPPLPVGTQPLRSQRPGDRDPAPAGLQQAASRASRSSRAWPPTSSWSSPTTMRFSRCCSTCCSTPPTPASIAAAYQGRDRELSRPRQQRPRQGPDADYRQRHRHPARASEPRIRSLFHHQAGRRGRRLGLSLCQRIVLANLGTIRIDSEVGKGTTITIACPPMNPRRPRRRDGS